MPEEKDKVVVNIESLVGRLADGVRLIPTIYRVHDRVHRECYEPEIVSIGPIHQGKDNLKGMEQHKVTYLSQLLQRRGGDLTLEDCVRKLRPLEQSARMCYQPPPVSLNQDEFLEMLIFDGFFVIELMRKYWFGDLRDENDPIFHNEHVLNKLRNDLMMFENQLPLFVLDHLFEMTKTGDPEDNIRFLALSFVERLVSSEKEYAPGKPSGAHHLLGLVYESRYSGGHVSKIERRFIPGENPVKSKELGHINTASDLKKAGIKFKASSGTAQLDISFFDGVLYLPPLRVSDHTEPFMRNLIAYEQQLPFDRLKHVTEYAFLMHCLINSKRDVRVLRSAGVIANWLSDDRGICSMFNRLGVNVVRSPESCYSDVFEGVNRFCRARRNEWMAVLMQKHCSSPWTLVSVVAGAMLLVLTLTQTVFSILSFALKHH